MSEIRRINDDDGEAERVVQLWDRSCREDPDGGPLSAQGQRNLKRMLAMLAWHRDSFCLVAEAAEQGGEQSRGQGIVGYVLGQIDTGDGLLPGAVGLINEMYVMPEAPNAEQIRLRLLEAAVAKLRADGAKWAIRSTMDANDEGTRRLFERLGFTADMVTLSRYPEE